MKGVCVVCSNYKSWVDTESCCSDCRKLLHEEAPGLPLVDYFTIDQAVRELEERIPGLFVGSTCPLDFSRGQGCSCTTVCKALEKTSKVKAL